MNVPSPTPQTSRPTNARKRRGPQRLTPSIIEQRERKPFIFGWGAHLTSREREALKERIALFGGIAIAAIVALVLAWGWVNDNVISPANRAAADNKPVAQVGSDMIRMGYFKRYEKFQKTRLTSQQTQDQQALSQYTSQPKKYAAQISQIQQDQSLLTQELSNLGQNSLQALIDDDVMFQRAKYANVVLSQAQYNKAWKSLESSAGGPIHLQQYIQQSGLSMSEMQTLVKAQVLQQQLNTTLAKQVPHSRTEVRASHILIPATKKSLADQVYNMAKRGSNFAALAKKYSKDPGSAKKGGDLGFFPQGQMVPEFNKAAFSMKVGEIRLIKSSLGYHIIKLTGRKQHQLTAQEYKTAQQNAFGNWLSKEQAALTIRRFVAVQNLPGQSSTTTAPTGSLSGSTTGSTSGSTSGSTLQTQPRSQVLPHSVAKTKATTKKK